MQEAEIFDQNISSIMNEVAGIERDFQIDKMNETNKQKKHTWFGATSPIGFNQSGYLQSIKETPRKI